jgi:DNA-binding transcriptional regulator YiaG
MNPIRRIRSQMKMNVPEFADAIDVQREYISWRDK